MSSVAVFNGYGKYESTNDGQKGITLSHGGVPFWLPFGQVTYIPDFTMREVNHRESSADPGSESILTYQTFRISGERIAEELLETQIPIPNSYRGIMVIENEAAKRKNSYARVFAGYSEDGKPIAVDVQEIQPTPFEIQEAHNRARRYKEEIIQSYFQGKRERMMGGFGHPAFPTGLVRVYMEELGIQDIDDVTKKLEAAAATPGTSSDVLIDLLKQFLGQRPEPSKNATSDAPAAKNTIDPSKSAPSEPRSAKNKVESLV